MTQNESRENSFVVVDITRESITVASRGASLNCYAFERMATFCEGITPSLYFKPGYSLDEGHVNAFRDLYRRLSEVDRFGEHAINRSSLIEAAQQLGVKADSDDERDVLTFCVQHDDDETTFECLDVRIGCTQILPSPVRPLTLATTPDQPEQDGEPARLTEIKCVLVIKRQAEDVNDFLRTFLLQIPKDPNGNE